MPSVLLGGFLGGSAGRTPLGQPDPETRTGRTKSQISTWKPESDGQQPPRAGPTLSETKSIHVQSVTSQSHHSPSLHLHYHSYNNGNPIVLYHDER